MAEAFTVPDDAADCMRSSPPRRAVLAGIFHFATIFALGFILGAVRTIFVADAPSARRLVGVLIELPIMLLASWFACGSVVRGFEVSARVWPRAFMGAAAFGLLIVAEMAVGALLSRRTISEHFQLYRELSYMLGLLMPSGPLFRIKDGQRARPPSHR